MENKCYLFFVVYYARFCHLIRDAQTTIIEYEGICQKFVQVFEEKMK